MNRFNRYLLFRKKVRKTAYTLASAECCPLGCEAITGYHNAKHNYNKLPLKWQSWVDKYVGRRLNEYHKPVVVGKDGKQYSAYDMDRAMMMYS